MVLQVPLSFFLVVPDLLLDIALMIELKISEGMAQIPIVMSLVRVGFLLVPREDGVIFPATAYKPFGFAFRAEEIQQGRPEMGGSCLESLDFSALFFGEFRGGLGAVFLLFLFY